MKRSWLWAVALMVVPFLGGARECEPGGGGGGCACPEIWAPVCGADGVTYGNTCEADCAGVAVAHDGECAPEPRVCWDDPDCGPGERCNHDECHSPCGPGEICPAVCYGVCEPEPAPTWCGTDADCAAGEICNLDGCPVCAPGDVCPAIACAGTCEPAPVPGCLSSDDCAPGEHCALDRCLAPPGAEDGEASLTVCYGSCEPTVCPAIACEEPLDCPHGVVTDPHGCPTCECAAPPPPPGDCPPVLCTLYCEHGFASDEDGCAICVCAEPG